jgi:hypothetical protein
MTYDLKEYQNKRHVRTVKYNVPYAIAKFYKNTLEAMIKAPGTYFKITKN